MIENLKNSLQNDKLDKPKENTAFKMPELPSLKKISESKSRDEKFKIPELPKLERRLNSEKQTEFKMPELPPLDKRDKEIKVEPDQKSTDKLFEPKLPDITNNVRNGDFVPPKYSFALNDSNDAKKTEKYEFSLFSSDFVESNDKDQPTEKEENNAESNEAPQENNDINEAEAIEKNVIKIDRVNGDPEKNKEIQNNLQPNTIYEYENGDSVETDEKGRVIKSTFTPVLVEDKRTPEDSQKTQAVGKEGKEGDEGGHIQAHSLGGSSERINLFPQDANFNRGEYKKIENSIRNDLKEGKDVKVTVELIYDDPDSSRPSRVRVTKTVTDSNGNVEVTSITKENAPQGAQNA